MSGTTTPFDCPRCGVGLAMSERQGIEIDYCPQCRGVWLDRGELDKLVERAEAAREPPPSPSPSPGQPATSWGDQLAAGAWTQPSAPPQRQQPWDGGQQGHDHGHGHKGRKSWLGELFD